MNTVSDLFKIVTNHTAPTRGRLLLAEPFMCDCMFGRAVIFLAKHDAGGSMGFVLNKPFPLSLNDVMPGLDSLTPITLHRGGPVGTDTLFYLHTLSELPEAMPVGGGVYMNGDFDALKAYLLSGAQTDGVIRFFLGYAGWGAGQLDEEIGSNTWLTGDMATIESLMNTVGRDEALWKDELRRMGGKYELWSRFPQMPIFN